MNESETGTQTVLAATPNTQPAGQPQQGAGRLAPPARSTPGARAAAPAATHPSNGTPLHRAPRAAGGIIPTAPRQGNSPGVRQAQTKLTPKAPGEAPQQRTKSREHSRASTSSKSSRNSSRGRKEPVPVQCSTASKVPSERSPTVSTIVTIHSTSTAVPEPEGPLPPAATELSPRAAFAVARVNDLMTRYRSFTTSTLPDGGRGSAANPQLVISEEEQVMCEVLLSLYSTNIGPLFLSQPEISFSNRSCVLATPAFERDEVVAGYRVTAPYTPGTVGRSYFATKLTKGSVDTADDGASQSGGASTKGASSNYSHSRGGSSIGGVSAFSLAEAQARKSAVVEKDTSSYFTLKVVCFRLRKELVKDVIADQCSLTKLKSPHVLRVSDVLKDEYMEKVIVVTNYMRKGSIVQSAGKLDDNPRRFCRIAADVAVGLSLLHSNKLYHHNLKLENVIEASDDVYCVSDAGFHRLFSAQCPEALIFNGELAALPPEVFDRRGPYFRVINSNDADLLTRSGYPATVGGRDDGIRSSPWEARAGATGARGQTKADKRVKDKHNGSEPASGAASPRTSPSMSPLNTQEARVSAAKVDVWGYGVLLYRLAFGDEPLQIAMCHVEEVCEIIGTREPVFPVKPTWPFYDDLVAVMKACFQKDPAKRPTMQELLKMPFFDDMGVRPGTGFQRNVSLTSSTPMRGFEMDSLARSSSSAGKQKKSGHGKAKKKKKGYTVEAPLGKGRISDTMRVHQRRNPSRRFAFKILKRSPLSHAKEQKEGSRASHVVKEARVQSMMRDLAVLRKMVHPNMVPYIDIVEGENGMCFVVQEYLKDGPLQQFPPLMSLSPKTPTMERLLSDVLLGLVHLHDNDLAHLNLTPRNIFYHSAVGRYRIADFGPVFLTMDELMEGHTKGTPLYSLPKWIFTQKPPNPVYVDTFCVGLLAASAIPWVAENAWNSMTRRKKSGPLNVDEILRRVTRGEMPRLPPKLVDFICKALEGPTTARGLLEHPFFQGRYSSEDLPVHRIEVSPDDIARALQAKPEPREAQALIDVIGLDKFHDSQVLSGIVTEGGETSMQSVDPSLMIPFKGSAPCCCQCGVELTLAVFRCDTCPDLILCGKCTVSDTHNRAHALISCILKSIVERGDGTKCAQLQHTSAIQDQHALEAIEMKDNLPKGLLSQHLVGMRQMERSIARSAGMGANVGSSQRLLFGHAEFGSVIEDADCSMSTVGVRNSIVLKPFNTSFSNFTFSNAPHAGRDTFTPGAGEHIGNAFQSSRGTNASDSVTVAGNSSFATRNALLSQPPAPPPLGKSNFMKMASKPGKKLALPKAEDLEDLTWEEELRHCREDELSDLMLFSYQFTQVPNEVFNPPPLHVVFLDLSQNSLTSLPSELSLLTRLRKLVVAYNQLTALPDSLGSLEELENLDASHNKLTDLPMTFIYLTRLQSCAMDYNDFDSIPSCILDILPPSTDNQLADVSDGDDASSGENVTVEGGPNGSAGTCGSEEESKDDVGSYPTLNVLYFAANDRISTLPAMERFQRFRSLKIALDNEPAMYRYYMENEWEKKLPNVTVNWNKIYPDEIVPNLYCGSLRSAQSQMVYQRLGIGYVLTVGRGLMPIPPEGGHHRTIVVDDIPGADILSSMTEAIEFIDESRKAGSGCLVHCFAGLSRSATTVIAYLMVKMQMRLDEAYLQTKKGRPAILPNHGFFNQLLRLDGELYPKAERPLDIESLGRPGGDDAATNL